MAISSIAMKAYTNALESVNPQTRQNKGLTRPYAEQSNGKSFSDTIADSLKHVQVMENEKSTAIQAFASGENQNVHELMITLQKASVTMSMTTAVRNKVMDAYKELSRISF